MRFTRSRAAVLGAAALTVTLTACAPPGQSGEPGVAATYNGNDITNVRVDDVYDAWLTDTQGKDVANRRQIITIELLREDLLAKCDELGYPITRSTAKTYADQWITFKGVQGTASEEVIDATQGVLALTVVASLDPTFETLREISDHVAETVAASPRTGAYSTDALIDSVNKAMQSAEQQQLGPQFSYTELQNVSAFIDASRSWFDTGAGA